MAILMGEDYPLHVHLDKRTHSTGTVYVEQLRSFDFKRRNWKYVEMIPGDVLDEINQKVRLFIT